MGGGPPSVLIVEPRAHYPNGPLPRRSAELATAFAELGYQVELLTSLGWSSGTEHRNPSFTVQRWRGWARRLRHRYHNEWLFTALLVLEIRACVRRMVSSPEVIVLLAWDEIPSLLAAMAPLHQRWMVNQFRDARELPRHPVVDAIARRRERRRRSSGGAMRVVVAHAVRRAGWEADAPYLDPVVAPVAGVRTSAPVPVPDVREWLGLPGDARVALLFGEAIEKRRDVALDAFAELDDWTLVLGGPVADGVAPRPGLVRYPGMVDDLTRDRLFVAADLVVLSFAPDDPDESGTLLDAIAAGTPVVCCDDAAVAHAAVARYRLGDLYAGDDPKSLVAAVRAAPATIDPDNLATARAELSNRVVARKQLLVMGILPTGASTGSGGRGLDGPTRRSIPADRRDRLAIDASPEVRAALRRLGRTEDVRFSPDNRRLVLPSVADNSIALVDVDIDLSGNRPVVRLTGVDELAAPGLDYPHGVDFLDDATMVVANRNATVNVFRLRPCREGTELVRIDVSGGRGFEHMHGPSTVTVTRRDDGDTEIVIGHGYADFVSRHSLHRDDSGGLAVTSNEILLRQWITIVDGATISPDGRWLAISNPMHQHVLVYDTTTALHERSDPHGILRGASYPHGVRFSPDGRFLFVADAGSARVCVHAREGSTWEGVQYPARSLQVMDDDVFQRGRTNCREGGPKGVDVDRAGRVLAVTSEHQPLAFFDVSALHEGAEPPDGEPGGRLHHELSLIRATDALVEDRIADLEARLASVVRSRSYRLGLELQRIATTGTRWRRPAR